MANQSSWITGFIRRIGETIKHEKVLSALTTVCVVFFTAGVGVLKLPDFTKAREFFAISALSGWIIIVLSLARTALSRGWKIVWSVVSFLAASTFYFWLWYWVRELEAKETDTSADIPGIPQWLMRSIAYVRGLPWPWILISLAIGALVAGSLLLMIIRRRRLIEKLTPKIEILSPLDLWTTGWHRMVRGSVYPPESGVQVLVRHPNGGWHVQGVEVIGALWTSNCQFGDKEKPGMSYKIVAVYGDSLKLKQYDELPENLIRSEVITVNRNSNEDIIDCPDKQLHQTKIDDKSAIKELVKVCVVKCDTSIIKNGPPPYIDFDFWVLSLSLHYVSINSVSGYITFQKDATGDSIKLIGAPELREESHAENLAFRSTDGWLRIRQPLDLNQAPWVESGSDQSVFYFHHLNIMIEGDGFQPVRLDIDKVQKRIPYWAQDECRFLYATLAEAETKVRDLETANEALKSELDRLKPQASNNTERPE